MGAQFLGSRARHLCMGFGDVHGDDVRRDYSDRPEKCLGAM